MFSIIKFFEPRYGQKFLHRNTILEQQFNEIDAVVLERLHHGLVESTVWPFLAIYKYLSSCDINAIPG